ncbi:hypothetical protein B5F10_05630 [Anaerotruncus colihominis]|uniref:Uncharacterized protein n=1 Tax=Anaerotruncus colihominis TaxID=169435 RepID=A0A1Y4MQM3_9FIRM|nr:hypothetical protein B5F11_05440 [Anaerotruncus colihominis]OUP75226.1 hypothetical protein B5F10_05630 [Anaerotruncus colihominis]
MKVEEYRILRKQLLGCMVIIVLGKGAALGLRPFFVVQAIRSGPGEYSHRIRICCNPKLNEYFCLIMRRKYWIMFLFRLIQKFNSIKIRRILLFIFATFYKNHMFIIEKYPLNIF